MTQASDGRIFIAYDSHDIAEAQQLCARLEQAGFSVWVAGRDAAAGTPEQAHEAVRSAAARCACFLLLLSGRAVDMRMLGDLTHIADSAGRPVFPIRVALEAQVPDFPALARARAWIDICSPAVDQEYARLTAELAAVAPRHFPTASQQGAQAFQATQPPPHHYHPARPALAPQPGYGHVDWSSVEIQPGEVSLGSWLLAINLTGPDVSGMLTITDRRILFKPKIAGASLLGFLLSQRKTFKDRHTIVLSRDQVTRVHHEKHFISHWIYVTTADGAVCGFNRGLMSPDPIMAVLHPH